MKSTFFKISLVLLLFSSQLLIGQPELLKNYVAQENIAICEKGIFILGGESLIALPGLFHDEGGFYFLDLGAGWICNWCRTINPLDITSCQSCGESYGSNPS